MPNNVTPFKLRNQAREKTPGRDARFPGTKERLVGNDGNLNGYDKKDLLRTIGTLLSLADKEEVDVTDGKKSVQERKEMLTAAYQDRSSSKWAELGSVIAGQITEAADREGFMRRVLVRNDLQMGNFPRIRVRRKNVTALVMSTAAEVQPIYAQDDYLFPPELTVSANVRVTNREINQGTGDIVEDKFYESQEAIMVQEDLYWKTLADQTIGITYPLQYLVGGLNPTNLAEMRTELWRWNIPAMTVIMAADYWNDILGNGQFSAWFDPVSKYEIVTTGELGTLLGLTFVTDGFRQHQLQVLQAGEFYMVSDPAMHGGYTDRGPVQSNEVNQYPDGVPARGWFMFEEMSFVIGNSRSIIKGSRA